MLPWDPSGKTGPKKPQPDVVKVLEPKDEDETPQPTKSAPRHAAGAAAGAAPGAGAAPSATPVAHQ
jgi:small subunit ribosomal protein S3e